MTVSTEFEATGAGMELQSAILIYQALPRTEADAFASVHRVEHSEAGPMLAAGAPLNRGHLRRWSEALGRTAVPEILPENVLVAHPDVLAWWVPEQVRPAYFRLSNPPKGLKAIAPDGQIKPVPYPAHLLVASRGGLGVYALAQSKRPDAATVALHSPILNVFLNGTLCWGNVAKPRTLSVAAMPEFERALFDSWSTHPNAGQDQTLTGKGGLVRLWDELADSGARRFPVRRLKPFYPATRRPAKVAPVTIGQLIAGAAK